MTFYEQVRSFFKKYDPARIILAKRIALTYKTPRAQKEVMKRLNQVYAAGGPSNFDFSVGKVEKRKVIEQVVEQITEEVTQDVDEIEDIDGADDLKEVTE
jgi:uncharacterized protein with NRDE domain